MRETRLSGSERGARFTPCSYSIHTNGSQPSVTIAPSPSSRRDTKYIFCKMWRVHMMPTQAAGIEMTAQDGCGFG